VDKRRDCPILASTRARCKHSTGFPAVGGMVNISEPFSVGKVYVAKWGGHPQTDLQ